MICRCLAKRYLNSGIGNSNHSTKVSQRLTSFLDFTAVILVLFYEILYGVCSIYPAVFRVSFPSGLRPSVAVHFDFNLYMDAE